MKKYPSVTISTAKLTFFTSKKINGLGRISYDNYLTGNGDKLQLALAFEKFSNNKFTPEGKKTHFLNFEKLVPSIKYVFPKKHPRSSTNAYLQWKTFFIKETTLSFYRDTFLNEAIITYPTKNRILHQLQFV